MKVISLHEPWAILCVLADPDNPGFAEKANETRHWTPEQHGIQIIGQRIMIHAAMKWDATNKPLRMKMPFYQVLARHSFGRQTDGSLPDLPFGCIVGSVKVVSYTPTLMADGTRLSDILSLKERAFGNYAIERFAWQFCDPICYAEPIPLKGQQAFFNYDGPLPIEELRDG